MCGSVDNKLIQDLPIGKPSRALEALIDHIQKFRSVNCFALSVIFQQSNLNKSDYGESTNTSMSSMGESLAKEQARYFIVLLVLSTATFSGLCTYRINVCR